MEKIRIGIIGCGGIAGTMAATLAKMDSVILAAAASRNSTKAETFSHTYGFKKAYGSYEELAADPDIDLVYIATPHSDHYETVKRCLEHGKNVLCEKSFTVNTKQAEELFRISENKKLLLTEALWVRYMPLTKTLKDMLAQKIIGEPAMCTANLHYIIDSKQRLTDPELAGGALLDVGVYALSFASIVFGDDIKKITATAVMTDKGVDRQDVIAITYSDGKMAALNCGISCLSDRQGIVYGRNGYIIVDNINNPEAINVYSLDRKLIQRIEAPKQISGYEYEIIACAAALREGRTECPEMPHAETITIMKQMDEIRKQIGLKYPFEK